MRETERELLLHLSPGKPMMASLLASSHINELSINQRRDHLPEEKKAISPGSFLSRRCQRHSWAFPFLPGQNAATCASLSAFAACFIVVRYNFDMRAIANSTGYSHCSIAKNSLPRLVYYCSQLLTVFRTHIGGLLYLKEGGGLHTISKKKKKKKAKRSPQVT